MTTMATTAGANLGMTSVECRLTKRASGAAAQRYHSWQGFGWVRNIGVRAGMQPADICPFDANVRMAAGCGWGVEVTNPFPGQWSLSVTGGRVFCHQKGTGELGCIGDTNPEQFSALLNTFWSIARL